MSMVASDIFAAIESRQVQRRDMRLQRIQHLDHGEIAKFLRRLH